MLILQKEPSYKYRINLIIYNCTVTIPVSKCLFSLTPQKSIYKKESFHQSRKIYTDSYKWNKICANTNGPRTIPITADEIVA